MIRRPHGRGLGRGRARLVASACVLLLALARGSGARAEEPRPGVLLLRVYRPGTVWLDDSLIRDLSGRTERAPRAWDTVVAQSAELAAGRYRLRLKPADDLTLSPLDETEFTLAPGETTEVALGRPLLISSPDGAAVRIGALLAGTTPLRLDPAGLGLAAVTLERPGYRPWRLAGDSLLVRSRETGSVRVELEPLGARVASPGARRGPRRYLGLKRRPALIASVGLVTTGVTSAILLKRVADDRFESYRSTGDPGRQRRFFSSAERYDRLSLIGWSVAEAAFFASFFLIIQEEPRGLVPTLAAARTVDGSPGWRVGVSHGF